MNHHSSVWSRVFATLAALLLLLLCVVFGAQEQGTPRFTFDPGWPRPLPNKWKMGGGVDASAGGLLRAVFLHDPHR